MSREVSPERAPAAPAARVAPAARTAASAAARRAPGRAPALDDDDSDPEGTALQSALSQPHEDDDGNDDNDLDRHNDNADTEAPVPFRSSSPPLPAMRGPAAAPAADERPLGGAHSGSGGIEEAPLRASSVFNSSAKDPFAGMADAYPPGFDPASLENNSAGAGGDDGTGGGSADDSAWASLPVEDRFVHKNFKARISAYDELRAAVDASVARGERGATSMLLNERAGLLRGAIKKEPHALAGEKLLDLLLAWADAAAPALAQSCAEASAAAVAEQLKGRPAAAAKAQALLLLFIEVGGWEPVLDALAAGGKGKNPKAAAECVRTLRTAVAAFGPRVLPPQKLLKPLAALLGSPADAVRRAAAELVCELDRWSPPGVILQALQGHDVRPAVIKEVGDAIALAATRAAAAEEGVAPPQATRFVRGKDGAAAAGRPSVATAGGGSRASMAGAAGADMGFTIELPAKDVCAEPQDFATAFEAAPVWAERRALLTGLCTAAAGASRVTVSGATHSAMAVVRKIGFSDPNAAVVAESVKAIAALARKAGPAFAPVASSLIGPMLALLREKKPAVARPLEEALDALWNPGCIDRSSAFDAVAKATANKVIAVRAGACAWLVRAASLSAAAPGAAAKTRPLGGGRGDEAVTAALGDALVPLLDESDSTVRVEALELLARLALPLRKRFDALLSKLPPKRAEQLRERVAQVAGSDSVAGSAGSDQQEDSGDFGGRGAGAAATHRGKSTVSSPQRPTARPSTSSSSNSSSSSSSSSARPGTAAATGAPSARARPATAATATSSSGAGSGASGAGAPKLGAPSKEYKDAVAFAPESVLPLETAQERLSALVDPDLLGPEALSSKNWKQASDACEALQTALLDLPPAQLQEAVAPLFSVLKATPGFGPAHAAVGKAVCELLTAVVADVPATAVTQTQAARPLADLLPRLTDRKVADAALALLSALSECVGPCFVLVQLRARAAALKAPKAVEAAAGWVETVLREFGVLACDPRAVLAPCADWLESANAGVRTAALGALVEMHRQTGGALDEAVLAELKPAQAARVKTAFAECSEEEMAEGRARALDPPRRVRNPALRQQGGGSGGSNSTSAANALDALVAQVDLSAGAEALMKQMRSKDWKERKAALDTLTTLVPEKPNSVGPKEGGLLDAVTERLDDTNKNLSRQALYLIGRISRAMGPPVRLSGRKALAGLLTKLDDGKGYVKAEAEEALMAWTAAAGLQASSALFAGALKRGAGRREVLAAINAAVAAGPLQHESTAAGAGFLDMAAGLVASMTDRSAEVKNEAEKLLPRVIAAQGGLRALQTAAETYPKAIHLDLTARIERALQEAHAQGAVSSSDNHSTAVAAAVAGTGTAARAGHGAASARAGSSSGAPARAGTANASAATAAAAATTRPGTAAPASRGGPAASATAAASRGASHTASHAPAANPAATLAAAATIDEPALRSLGRAARAARLNRDAKRVRTGGAYRDMDGGEVAELHEDLARLCASRLARALVSLDHRIFCDGAATLTAALEVQLDEALESVDIVLRLCAYRLHDSNPAALAATLALLVALLTATAEAGAEGAVSELDVAVFLPFLVEKMFGHNNAKLRTQALHVLNLLCNVAPPARVLPFLLDGCRSKSKRVVADCAEEVGALIQARGLHVAPARTLPVLVSLIGAADAGVRTAALNALVRIHGMWTASEAELWRLLEPRGARIPDRERQMIVDRFRRASLQQQQQHGGMGHHETEPTLGELADSAPHHNQQQQQQQPVTAAAAVVPSLLPAGSQIASPSRLRGPSSTAAAAPAAAVAAAGAAAAQSSAPVQAVGVTALAPYLSVLASSRSEDECVEAMRQAWMWLSQANADALCPDAGLLCELLVRQVNKSFGAATEHEFAVAATSVFLPAAALERPMHHRLCKYALNTVMEVFKHSALALAVPQPTLRQLHLALLGRLLDPRLRTQRQDPEVRGLVKGLNVLMLKVLDAGGFTAGFVTLLDFLTEGCADSQQKVFTDLVVRCVVKLAKKLAERVDSLDVAAVLGAVHVFLVRHPPASFAEQGRDDMPLKTVRTVVTELIKLRGEALLQDMGELPGNSRVVAWFHAIYAHLRQQAEAEAAAAAVAAAASPADSGEAEDSVGALRALTNNNNAATATASSSISPSPIALGTPMTPSVPSGPAPLAPADAAVHTALNAIWERVRTKETSADGLIELAAFRRTHPDAPVEEYIAKSSSFFGNYVRRELEKIELAEAARAAKSAAAAAAMAAAAPEADDDAEGDVDADTYAADAAAAAAAEANADAEPEEY